MAKDWNKKETSYLERHAAGKQLDELAQRFEVGPAEVQAQLDKLGLRASDSPSASRLGNEPLLETYQKGLEALYAGKREQAVKLLTTVAEECDQPELAERARQMVRAAVGSSPGGEDGAAQDDMLVAVFEKNRGNYDRALEIAKRGGRGTKDERWAYLVAAIHASGERVDEAAAALATAIELSPENRVHAFHDPDFAALRKSDEHAELFSV